MMIWTSDCLILTTQPTSVLNITLSGQHHMADLGVHVMAAVTPLLQHDATGFKLL